MLLFTFAAFLCAFAAAIANSYARSALEADTLTTRDPSSLRADLGHSIYQGYHNATSKLDVFKGIRFAEPPLGRLRWQPPKPPSTNRNKTVDAQEYSLICPQNNVGMGPATRPTNDTGTSEDCLFLNVWAPRSHGGAKLPVMVWIHGGAYGFGNGRYDFSDLINTNNNSFVGVSIQYRLGAFGFLSSDEVHRKGVPNAGLLDQHLALEWVQQYIHLFNGDKNRVTLAGESAGAGSVMLHAMAYGGTRAGRELFRNVFGASPYLPPQYGYKDWIPSQSYYAFASAAGCDARDPYLHEGALPIFECLQGKDSRTLINASMTVSAAGLYGALAFAPATDGTFVQQRPSVQLAEGKVNGVNGLFGNNANEGFLLVPQTIKTEKALVEWLKITFPLFSDADIKAVLDTYPSTDAPDNPEAPLFATNGISGPTAVNQSSLGTGQQQRATLIYGEATFGHGYKYQFSVPPSIHSADLPAYFPTVPSMTAHPFPSDFSTAFQTLIGNFVVNSNPLISSLVANGVSTGNMSRSVVSDWPVFDGERGSLQVDLNTTCTGYVAGDLKKREFPYCAGEDNQFSVVDADTWEGGRGRRCEFWRDMGRLVPE
ncbi:hypothetical protein M409DRAFT_26197 [Zasmidium cellare ATCC 36951]|uniref:Carboxylesterase type B domain-containing protein n=1 Tax=Zasmidium cellare ATCC 36951 TaxID=1080233 RepID=A0A6A6CBK9_ZASCE|nr:uncharacterized protein M409DRAFT_26197 [Zasmidium cellare ATCC 36951]KAF2163588.1 hypothetical protein M409DRAFT_26197 [Zasmidium cellare ATCC 36951]